MKTCSKMNSILFTMIIVITLFTGIHSDIPVHCVSNQVFGEWTFEVSKETFNAELNNQKTTCGHGFPDIVDKNASKNARSTFPEFKIINIKLNTDFQVQNTNGENIGSFSLVYDEGMIINIHNASITVYFKYYKDGGVFKSSCSETMLGWYIPDVSTGNKRRANWSCIWGEKSKDEFRNPAIVDPNMTDKSKASKDEMLIQKSSNDSSDSDSNLFLQTKTSTFTKLKSSTTPLDMSKMYDSMNSIVDEINSSKISTWKAGFNGYFKGMNLAEVKHKVNLNRKTHIQEKADSVVQSKSKSTSTTTKNKDLESFKSALNQSYFQLKSKNLMKSKTESKFQSKTTSFSYSEEEDTPSSSRDKDSKLETSYAEVSKYLKTDIDQIEVNSLPLNWDWRNVGGDNYVPQPKIQGDCGSCYVFASMSALESRLRIQTHNKDQTVFSRQFILSCNIYTEGCEGGYPVLIGKFANEFELIPESCMPYKEQTGTCSNYCDYKSSPKKYTVSRYGYLGGHYGATSEEDMVKELRARGPILGNLAVPWTFSYYKSGIFAHDHVLKKNNGDLSETTIMDKNIPWEKVDHSTLIIGYGEENGIKFWICMNTWGTDWGENGYYRILRGVNESFIESMGDVLDVKVEDR